MPRFLLELEPATTPERDGALRLASMRYPEIALELGFSTRGDDGVRELWMCRAPSASHLRRWVDAAGLTAIGLRRIDSQNDLSGSPPVSRSG